MLTCRAASERLSRSLDGPLPGIDRFALGAHLLVCPACRQFRSQFLAIHKASANALTGTCDVASLSDDSKRRIALEMERQV